jgi:hypothetical protein
MAKSEQDPDPHWFGSCSGDKDKDKDLDPDQGVRNTDHYTMHTVLGVDLSDGYRYRFIFVLTQIG